MDLEDIKKDISVEGERFSINHLDNQDSAVSISARTDKTSIGIESQRTYFLSS